MSKKILVIDDDKGVAMVLKEMLESVMPDFQVDVILRFSLGMEKAKSAEICGYSAVLLDGQIDAGHGYDIAEALRANSYKGIIFSIAGRALCDAVPEKKRWLYNGSYQKPVPFHELAGELLDVWLREDED